MNTPVPPPPPVSLETDLATEPALGLIGQEVGPYRVLEQIGTGGFGDVYLAEQHRPIRRQVALKVIKPGMDSDAVVARFAAERQALALMDSPHIARVYEAGTTAHGRLYFAMELVRGEPIHSYCDLRKLNTEARVRLFVPVCRAVQHAHQKGIVHRDLKPANVLVAEHASGPVPKIIDFGIAKALSGPLTDNAMHTRRGQIIGTPAYMSPEQAESSGLDVDARSDVYGLGVVLFELLTGLLPHDPNALARLGEGALSTYLRDCAAPRPSQRVTQAGAAMGDHAARRSVESGVLCRQLRGDLDVIAIKALAADRTQRYQTADALADDLQRFLAGEPVTARAPSAVYKFRKLVRRNRPAVAAAGLVTAAVLGAGVLSTHKAVVAQRAHQTALAERDAADHERAAAQDQAARANAVRDLLLSMLSAPGQDRGYDYTVRQLLDDISSNLDLQLVDQPDLLSEMHGVIGMSYGSLGLTEPADRHLRLGGELARQAGGENGLAYARILASEGWVLTHAHGHPAAGVERYERSLKTVDDQLSPHHPDRIKLLRQLSDAYTLSGRLDDAERTLAAAAQAIAVKAGGSDATAIVTLDVTRGLLMLESNRSAEAEPLLRSGLRSASALLGPDHPETLRARERLVRVLAAQDKIDEALAQSRELIESRKRRHGADHPAVQRDVLAAAVLLRTAGRVEAGLEFVSVWLDQAEAATPRPAAYARALAAERVRLQHLAGRFDELVADANRLVTDLESDPVRAGVLAGDLVHVFDDVASDREKIKDFGHAADAYGLQARVGALGGDRDKVRGMQYRHAKALLAAERFDQAVDVAGRVVSLSDSTAYHRGAGLTALTRALLGAERYEEAAASALRLLKHNQKNQGPTHGFTLMALEMRIRALVAQGLGDQAREELAAYDRRAGDAPAVASRLQKIYETHFNPARAGRTEDTNAF